MLRILRGAPGSGKTFETLRLLAEDLSAGKATACILVVPEQQVVEAERLAATCFREKGDAAMRIEVLSFRRLCNRVFREAGGVCYHYLDEGGKLLLLYQVAEKLREELSEYGGKLRMQERNIRETEALLAQLTSFKRAGITPEMLMRAEGEERLAGDHHKRLRAKLHDLALLMSGLEEAMGDRFDDPECDIDRLILLLSRKKTDFFFDKSIYFDGFNDLTGKECALLRALLCEEASLTVTVNRRKEDKRLFLSRVERFEKTLLRLAEESGSEVEICDLGDENRGKKPDSLRSLERHFYGGTDSFAADDGAVTLIAAATPYEEVRLLAEDILRDVREGGHYRDHAVAARDTARYLPLLESVFAACGIPIFLSVRGGLIDHAAVRTVYYALELIREGFPNEQMLRYVKTGFAAADVGEDDCLLYEQYIRGWALGGKYLVDRSLPFTMHPDGYKETFDEGALARLQRLNALKPLFGDPLEKLRENFSRAENVGEQTAALYTYLGDLRLREQLQKKAEEARREGRRTDAERMAQIWNLLVDTLDTLYETVGTLRCGAQTFENLFLSALQCRDVASIPTSLDEVTFSDALLLRGENVKTLHLLGVNDGVFPAAPAGSAIFDEHELSLLKQTDPALDWQEDRSALAEKELHLLYLCLALPKKRLRVSYARRDLDGSGMHPSDAIGEICRVLQKTPLPAENIPLRDRLFHPGELPELLAAHRADGDAFAAAARELLGQTLDRPLSVDEETVGAPYTETLNNGVLTLSPSRLETYADCPYSYHLHYTLKLQEERTGEWKNTERGEVIHLILERFLRKMKDENRFDGGAPIEDAEITSLVSGILGEYCENVCGGREMQPRLRRLLRQTESLAVLLLKDMRDEFGTGKFRPAFFELPVGSTGAEEDLPDGVRLPAVALPRDSDEKQLCIRGKIDRVDCYRDGEDLYLRVVDYKTYQKTLSLEDLKSGHNLQMPLYLCALCEEENTDAAKRLCPSPTARRIPAGTVYYIAKQTAPLNRSGMSAAEMEKKICDRIERNGFTSSDPKVLEAIDPTASGRFYQKRGLITEEEMREMLELSSEKALELARDLRSGRADATPLRDGKNDSCRYCHMEQICRRCGRNEAGEGEEP